MIQLTDNLAVHRHRITIWLPAHDLPWLKREVSRFQAAGKDARVVESQPILGRLPRFALAVFDCQVLGVIQ